MIRKLLKTMVSCVTLPLVLVRFGHIQQDLDVLEGRLIVLEGRLVNIENVLLLNQEIRAGTAKRQPQA